MTREQIIKSTAYVVVAVWTYLVWPLVKAYGAKLRQTVVGRWAYQLVLVSEKSGVPGSEKFKQAVTALLVRLTNNKWMKKYKFTEADAQAFVEEAYNLMVANGAEKKSTIVTGDETDTTTVTDATQEPAEAK